jgi:protein phosphatase PTC7
LRVNLARRYYLPFSSLLQGISFGVADGVGGWVESGVDPSLFSQALMYHAHRYSRSAWAGEPEIDPTMDYEEREQIEGWEMTPYECLDLAYGGVLREKYVQAGEAIFQIQIQHGFTPVQGSSTACMVSLNASSGILRSAKSVQFSLTDKEIAD